MKTPYQFGQAAFQKGICAPALDAEFLATLNPQAGSNVKALLAWYRGWTHENLSKTVVFTDGSTYTAPESVLPQE